MNRSRLHQTTLNGSESPRSIENLHLLSTKTTSQFGRDSANGSPDEQLFMLDKTLRNSMIQDVQYCKQQLLQLRSILQEVSMPRFTVKAKKNQKKKINTNFFGVQQQSQKNNNNIACRFYGKFVICVIIFVFFTHCMDIYYFLLIFHFSFFIVD